MDKRLKLMAQQLTKDLEEDFKSNFYKRAVDNKENLDGLQVGINMMLDKYSYKYGLPLEPVKVTSNGRGTITVDLLSAFKKYPKIMQQMVACEIAGVDMDDVDFYDWHEEGYIIGFRMKSKPIHHMMQTIKVD